MRIRTVSRAAYNQQLQKPRRKISNAATFLATGTPVRLWRFIADEIGDLINGGRFLLRRMKSPQSLDGGANAVSVLGRGALRADEDVVGRVRTRA
jgi:hypothetical protein